MQVSPATLVSLFHHRVEASGPQAAIHVRRQGRYAALTWNEVAADVRRLAVALAQLGVSQGDRVVQVSENRYEWILTDLAILLVQGVHVPIHAGLTGPQIAYQIADSGACLAIVSGPAQAEKLAGEWSRVPGRSSAGGTRRNLVSHDPYPGLARGDAPRVEHLARLAEQANPSDGLALEMAAVAAVRTGDLATILYTSGTTGEPKGVMLSQGNLASNALAVIEAFNLREGDLRLTWLPLSHIFARTCDLYAWLAAGVPLALADSRETVVANCGELSPSLINGVPYFYEKLMRHLVEQGLADTPGSLQKLLGGRMRLCCSGGAALPDHVAEFYARQGLLLIQGYGLTECSPVMTMSTEAAHRLGSAGQPPRGVEVRIAPDGEVLTRGPHVMLGYWNKPQATAESLRDGWLYSGDLGRTDDDGFLWITGRKKELIVTSGGKNIAPVLLESLLTEDPLIQQALVVGDGRSHLAALVVVAPGPLEAELQVHEPVASAGPGVNLGPGCTLGPHVLADPRVRDLYRRRIEARLALVSDFEQVRRFVLLAQPFSLERDELTPTLKLRRATIVEHYADEIERMYRQDD